MRVDTQRDKYLRYSVCVRISLWEGRRNGTNARMHTVVFVALHVGERKLESRKNAKSAASSRAGEIAIESGERRERSCGANRTKGNPVPKDRQPRVAAVIRSFLELARARRSFITRADFLLRDISRRSSSISLSSEESRRVWCRVDYAIGNPDLLVCHAK